jgi:tyrosinase
MIYTSSPADISFAAPEHRCYRVDLEIDGIVHGGPSYRGLVFLGNDKADETTPRTLDNGYAGVFDIFAHGGCLGDPGHCEVNEHNRETFDFRPPNPLTPARKRVTVTEAVRELAKSKPTATVTVVPLIMAMNSLCETREVFKCESMSFVTYN